MFLRHPVHVLIILIALVAVHFVNIFSSTLFCFIISLRADLHLGITVLVIFL